MKGYENNALEVLAALSGSTQDDDRVQAEFHAIKDTVIEASKGSFRDLFTMGEDRHFHRVALAYVNQVFQQISGISMFSTPPPLFRSPTPTPLVLHHIS